MNETIIALKLVSLPMMDGSDLDSQTQKSQSALISQDSRSINPVNTNTALIDKCDKCCFHCDVDLAGNPPPCCCCRRNPEITEGFESIADHGDFISFISQMERALNKTYSRVSRHSTDNSDNDAAHIESETILAGTNNALVNGFHDQTSTSIARGVITVSAQYRDRILRMSLDGKSQGDELVHIEHGHIIIANDTDVAISLL